MDNTTVALIASCCILLAFIIGASLVLAYKCFRHLEARKLQRLSSRVQRDVAIWAMSASNEYSMYGAGADHPNYLTDYRPKIYGAPGGYYIPEESYRESDPKKRGDQRTHRHDRHRNHVTSSTQRGHAVSVINVRDQTPGEDDAEIVSSNHVVSGHIYTLPTDVNGEVVYGRPPRRISEDDLQVTMLQKTNNVVQGYIVEDGAGAACGRGLASSTMVQHHERDTDSRQRGEVVHGQVMRPELVRGHVIKKHVEVGEDGKFVVSSSRQLDIYDQNIPDNVAPSSGGPQIVYGHYSTHRGADDHRSFSVTESQKHDVHSTVPAARNITTDHWPNSTAMALEGIAAAGVSVSVPHIIVTETLDQADARSVTGSDVSDDNVGVKQKKESVSEFVNYKDNYKVIKKHSVHKIPDW
ncbi:unnamed protein product [Lymnaea stagnalis]|uniref:Uncharacterized protein n=1 Tax=Lymnaea stagnalis TaxID=6523 RepID=A0AAV2H852_LYMST